MRRLLALIPYALIGSTAFVALWIVNPAIFIAPCVMQVDHPDRVCFDAERAEDLTRAEKYNSERQLNAGLSKYEAVRAALHTGEFCTPNQRPNAIPPHVVVREITTDTFRYVSLDDGWKLATSGAVETVAFCCPK